MINRGLAAGKRPAEFYHFTLYVSVEYHPECHSCTINMSIRNDNEKIIILMVLYELRI